MVSEFSVLHNVENAKYGKCSFSGERSIREEREMKLIKEGKT